VLVGGFRRISVRLIPLTALILESFHTMFLPVAWWPMTSDE
jgi:hypothetical protein